MVPPGVEWQRRRRETRPDLARGSDAASASVDSASAPDNAEIGGVISTVSLLPRVPSEQCSCRSGIEMKRARVRHERRKNPRDTCDLYLETSTHPSPRLPGFLAHFSLYKIVRAF